MKAKVPHDDPHMSRFLTAKELIDSETGEELLSAIDTEEAILMHGPQPHRASHLVQFTSAGDIRTTVTVSSSFAGPLESSPISVSRPGLGAETVAALRRPRVNQLHLSPAERDRFNRALKRAYDDGKYEPLAAIHANMSHNMHTRSDSNPAATLRFLPWHRFYLLQCENMLRKYEPLVRIPYWDYAYYRVRPDWVWQPPGVIRNNPGEAGGAPPTGEQVRIVENSQTYTRFTIALEIDAHNDVHNWCNGTITAPPTAAKDPIFWLLHANVDRIWARWQATHSDMPPLSGPDAVLDPWQPTTATDVNSILALGYWYRSEWHSILSSAPTELVAA